MLDFSIPKERLKFALFSSDLWLTSIFPNRAERPQLFHIPPVCRPCEESCGGYFWGPWDGRLYSYKHRLSIDPLKS